MKKLYFAGCGGMLGEAFYSQLNHQYRIRCTDIDVNEDWLTFLDFRDLRKYEEDVIRHNTEILFHIGAHTDLEFCELNADDTYRTNTTSVENAVFVANKLNIPLVYISTAGIFDGKKDFYDDWDLPNPICHYARSKYMGELFVKENVQKHLICRPGWMIGGGPGKDKKFVNKLIKQIQMGKKELFIVNDKFGTPTYTHDFVNNLMTLLNSELWGVYNMVCQGLTSRFEVAGEILKIMSLEKEITLREVTSDFFKETYFVQRPFSERLINKKLEIRGLNNMREWKLSLKEYLEKYF